MGYTKKGIALLCVVFCEAAACDIKYLNNASIVDFTAIKQADSFKANIACPIDVHNLKETEFRFTINQLKTCFPDVKFNKPSMQEHRELACLNVTIRDKLTGVVRKGSIVFAKDDDVENNSELYSYQYSSELMGCSAYFN